MLVESGVFSGYSGIIRITDMNGKKFKVYTDESGRICIEALYEEIGVYIASEKRIIINTY